MIRRLSAEEAQFVVAVDAPRHGASPLHEKLADARRLRTLRAELEAELRQRLPTLLAGRLEAAELEALFTALFGSRTP